jgi:hypothetical protein
MKLNLVSFDLKPPPAASECVRELFSLEPELAALIDPTGEGEGFA